MRIYALTTSVLLVLGCVAEGERGIPLESDPAVARPDDSPFLRADPPISVAFRANGDICTRDGDCSTGYCGLQTLTGERRCYGRKGVNEPCSTTFDCRVGVCASTAWPPSEDGPRVCVAAEAGCRSEGIGDGCISLAYQTCAYARACGVRGSFNACVQSACDDIAGRLMGDEAVNCAELLARLSVATLDSCAH